MNELTRDEWIQLEDDALLRCCRIDTMRGTGPGGQKRNKTESAVRLTHLTTGLVVTDDVSRSQHQNRTNALAKLRLKLALELRQESHGSPFPADPTNAQLPLWIARAFDALEKNGYQIAPSAVEMSCTTSHFLKLLAKSPTAWQVLQTRRQQHALPLLR